MKWIAGLLALILLPGFVVPAKAAELEVAGKSAVLMDMTTGTVLFENNSHEKLAPASVTKIMTMLLIMEAIDDGRLNLTDIVTASEEAAKKGGSQIYLKVGEQMTVSDMLKSIAVSSANDCACAMAEHLYGSEGAFVAKMNEKARELGMKDTNFVNCTGLDDDPAAAEHKTTAYDIALMSRELLKNHATIKKFTTIWMDSVRNGAFGLSNTNKLIRFYPGATGLKTGFTTSAGYCLSATAQREGMELIAVVMGAPSSKERNAACKQLLDYGFGSFALVKPELGEVPGVPVRLGTQGEVGVSLGDSAGLLIEKSKRAGVQTEVTLEPFVTAPVREGQKLGTFRILADGEILSELPLTAAETVERLSFGQLYGKILRKTACAA